MDARIGYFTLEDQTRLHYQHWIPASPKGVVLLVHGAGEHCGRYGPFAHYFLDHNFIVALYDQRGHGKSEGKRVGPTFSTLVDDLEQYARFTRETFSDVRQYFLVGHSLGGEVVLHFMAYHPIWFQAFAVSSPNIANSLPIPDWKIRFTKKICKVWPSFPIRSGVKPEMLSHDRGVVEAYRKDPLVFKYVSAHFGNEILHHQNEVLPALPTMIESPGLFLHGTSDAICSWRATEMFYQKVSFFDKRLRLFEGCYHELLNEVEKENVFEEIYHWFEAHFH